MMYPSNSRIILSAVLILVFATCIDARVVVEFTNRLHNGSVINLHCQSKDDDVGYHKLGDENSVAWSFGVNIWQTTLFYCDLQWGDKGWYHFDVYDASRDRNRCRSICRWMITEEGLLYGFDQGKRYWEEFPLISSSNAIGN